MSTAYKKYFIIVFFSIFISIVHCYAQDSCNNCSIDSLTQTYQNAKTDQEKVKLLTLLIDLRIVHININKVTEMSLDDDSTENYLRALIGLSSSQKVDNIDAYKSMLDAFVFFKKQDYLNGQNALKKSIDLFDLTHKKIPRLLFFTRLTFNFIGNQEDRLKYYSDKLKYYLTNGPVENTAPCYHAIAGYYLYKADYNLAISNYLKAAAVYKNYDLNNYMNDLGVVAFTYTDWGNYQKAKEYYDQCLPMYKMAKDSFFLATQYFTLSNLYFSLADYTSAIHSADTSLLYNDNQFPDIVAEAHIAKALALINMHQLNEALDNINQAGIISDSLHLKVFGAHGAVEVDYSYYKYYAAINNYDKAGKYLETAYTKSVGVKSNQLQLKYLRELSLFYSQQHNATLSSYYISKFFDLTDEQNKEQSSFKVAQYENEEKELEQNDRINLLKQEAAIQAAAIKKNTIIMWGSFVAILLISVSLFFVYRQYHLNKKTLLSLRKTQRQLIMAEKMASLGELTAGIAHEIQNPLNFVNNFSEVNKELLAEMNEEIEKGNFDEVKAIARDVTENQEKINHHGKRADAIVKGMLQHSRSSSGVKEPTDINALCDEYLRLAYHGLRAKDKSFNATMQTDFDSTIEKINIIPQDIGRVVLNLITNAFYAVNDKKKMQEQAGPNTYDPTVSISTKKSGNKVFISVKDNGSGIPQKVIDKIFQPFFTTKPTGEGTGLGLSLSYDIIKAHDGEINVETKEGEGTTFIIILPT